MNIPIMAHDSTAQRVGVSVKTVSRAIKTRYDLQEQGA